MQHTLKVQIKVEIFKKSGKWYAGDYVKIDAPYFEGLDIPAQLAPETFDLIKLALVGRYSGMTAYVSHELMVPGLISL